MSHGPTTGLGLTAQQTVEGLQDEAAVPFSRGQGTGVRQSGVPVFTGRDRTTGQDVQRVVPRRGDAVVLLRVQREGRPRSCSPSWAPAKLDGTL